jgi:hypothetical protein
MILTVRAVPKVILLVALAALARPAYATISYAACSSGCGANTNSTYAVWQNASGSAGLTFSMSPATFAGGNLVSGIYNDPTGTVLTGYNGANPDSLTVSGASLLQTVGGGGSGIEIALPANTYAFAMEITTPSGSVFTNPWVAVGNHNVGTTNYNIIIPSGGNVLFFGIISDTPLNELFVGSLAGGSALQINDFELGQATPTSTPEASNAVLIGGGLVLLGVLRRRRIHKPDGALA